MYKIFEFLLGQKGSKAADVARATGINQTVFSEWKKGKSTPKTEKMQKIADFFGVTVGYLMGNENEITSENRNSGKEKLSTLISEYPVDAIKLLSGLCKKNRIDKDLTEKAVAVNTGIPLNEYLRFENEFINIGLDNIINVIEYFELDIAFIAGYLTAILLEQKENETETNKLLNRLLIDEDFKNDVLETLKVKTRSMKESNISNQLLVQDSDVIDNLIKVLNTFSFKHNDN